MIRVDIQQELLVVVATHSGQVVLCIELTCAAVATYAAAATGDTAQSSSDGCWKQGMACVFFSQQGDLPIHCLRGTAVSSPGGVGGLEGRCSGFRAA